MRQGGYGSAFVVLLGLTCSGAQPSTHPAFIRPTLVATRVDTAPAFHRLIHEDDSYIFVERHYGSSNSPATPGLFVRSKPRGDWIEIVGLATERARFGRAPRDLLLAVGWDDGGLINEPFVTLPLHTSGSIRFPDRIVDFSAESVYRLDFGSGLDYEDRRSR